MSARELITEHLDLWTGAVTKKASSGRGSNGKVELTGVNKLRELILELAVRGQLTNQDLEDEPAYSLLERIEAASAKSTKKGRPFKAAPVEDPEKYFRLPPNWEWVRLGSIQEFTNGYAFKSSRFTDSGVGVIRIGDVSKDGKVTPKDMRFLSVEEADEVPPQFFVHPQDLVLTMTGDVKPGINDTKECFLLNQRVGKLTPYLVSKQFLFLYLRTVAQQKIANAFGGVIPNVSTREINESVMGLPPLEEQHRIVQKVDELMALCDRLEQQTNDQLEAHETLVDTLLGSLLRNAEGSLTQPENAAELADNWARIKAHFDTLFTTEQSIEKLKQTILQLAVMGRLVEQDAGDGTATELLAGIERHKQELVKAKEIKPPKKLPAITSEEALFDIPRNWQWVKFGELGLFINGDRSKNYPNKEEYVERGVAWINTGHIEPDGTLTQTQMNFIAREKFDSLRSGKIKATDLVYCLRGATFGKTAFVTPYQEGAIASSLMIIRPYLPAMRSFIYRYLTSPFGRSQIFRFDNGSAQPNLSANSVMMYAFPLPPLAEQYRIVQKVDELMALCDRLKERLNQASETRCQLAEAVVEGALN